MNDKGREGKARPHAKIIAELFNPCLPHSEQEHAAVKELTTITAERDALRAALEEISLLEVKTSWLEKAQNIARNALKEVGGE